MGMKKMIASIVSALCALVATAGTWDQGNWDEMYWDGGPVSKPTVAPQTKVAVEGTDFFVTILNYTEGSGEDGWSAILGYDVTCVDSRGVAKTYKGSPFYISDLDEETEYTCTVAAYNSKGYGPSSQFVATTEFMPGGLPIWLLYEASK
jgi:hypothetical protein